MPKVSVIIPTYNSGSFLDEAIKSIQSQTFRDLEILIVNDGSTDSSSEIIYALASEDPRIKVINKQNSGIVDSINIGIEKTDSEYICRMDADDISLQQRIELQIQAMSEKRNTVVCGSNIIKFGAYSQRTYYPLSNSACKTTLLINNCFAHPATMIRRSALDGIGNPYKQEYLYAEDYKLWSEISSKGDFLNIPTPLLRYRIHPGQTGSKRRELQRAAHAKVAKENLVLIGIDWLTTNQIRTIIWPDEAENKIDGSKTIIQAYSALLRAGANPFHLSVLLAKQAIKSALKRQSYV